MTTVPINKTSIRLLRISIGIIYIWFGALKFFSGYSPAEDLAMNTISKLIFGLIPMNVTIILLAIWECAVGLLLILGLFVRPVLIWLVIHMVCTFTPLLFFPDVTFKYAPYGITMVGQYIMKNIIIICAAAILWQENGELKPKR